MTSGGRVRNRALIGVLLFLAAVGARALDPARSIAQYGLDAWLDRDGLPQNSVRVIRQTRNGYLWLGTEEGLVRFDGVRFTVYSSRNVPAFRQNTVEAILEGRDGSLWIGTANGLLRKRGEEFIAYRVADGLPDDSVLSLLEDREGTLWIGTARQGLVRRSQERFHSPLGKAQGLPGEKVITLLQSRDGAVWIGTDSGLARLGAGETVAQAMVDVFPRERVNDLG